MATVCCTRATAACLPSVVALSQPVAAVIDCCGGGHAMARGWISGRRCCGFRRWRPAGRCVRASAVAAPAADGEECWSLATTTSDFLHIEVLEFFGDKTAARCCEEGYRLECRAVGPAYASSVAAAFSTPALPRPPQHSSSPQLAQRPSADLFSRLTCLVH